MSSPVMQAAEAVAALLNARPWPDGASLPAGVEFTAEAKRFPKWKRDDLKTLAVVTVPATPYEISVENRGDAITRECPVNVAIVQVVERSDTARQELLFELLDGVAELLARSELAGFGYPDSDEGIEAEWDAEELEQNGLFLAAVSAMYRVRDEAG